MRYYAHQVFRAGSRFINALTGGEGDSTFSAWSYHLWVDHNSTWGKWRVQLVDACFGPDHCKLSYDWHVQRELLQLDFPGE